MSAGNLGKASLTLSVKDKGLTSGLDKAKGGIGKWAGGLKAGVSAALGVVTSAVAAISGLGLLTGIQDMAKASAEAERLGVASEKLAGVDPKGLAKVVQANDSINSLGGRLQGIWNRVLVAAAPALTAVAGMAERYLVNAEPLIDWVTRFVGTLVEVGGPMVSGAFDALMGFGDEVRGLVGDLFGPLTDQMPTVEDVVVGALHGIGIAGAWVWDTFKAGYGAVAIGVGVVVEAMGKMAAKLGELADKSRWLIGDELANNLKVFGEASAVGADQIGNKLKSWGEKQLSGFGQSALKVDKWFENKEWEVKVKPKVDEQPIKAWEPKFAGAVLKGSTEDYSARVRFEAKGQDKVHGAAEKTAANTAKAVIELQKLNRRPDAKPLSLKQV